MRMRGGVVFHLKRQQSFPDAAFEAVRQTQAWFHV